MLPKVILTKYFQRAVLTRSTLNVTQKLREMSSTTPITDSIHHKLTTNLNTTHLEVINESYMHNVPKNSETHFKVLVVSENFNGLSLIKRHRIINDLLKEEFENGVHALSIIAKTPEQWQSTDTVKPSPPCLGGFGK